MNKTSLILAALMVFAIILSLTISAFWIFLIVTSLIHGNFAMAMISAIGADCCLRSSRYGYLFYKREFERGDADE